MPLVRFEVRNEHGLGDPELYRAAPEKKDDPKELLDGVAVAGLVGILRQLGDLAEFASDIFHHLHEQVTATSVRGRKLLTRIQHLETTLPSFETAVRGQRRRIHFSYVPGSDWHADLQIEQSPLLSSDLPRFMMDSYEECRDPPRLYLLDIYDSAGPGSCLKRYSDPSYFKRVWALSELEKAEKVQGEKKVQKIKRKGSQIRNGEVRHGISLSRCNSSARFASPSTDEQHFSMEPLPISDMKLKPELASRSTSFGSRTRLYYEEQVPDTNSSGVPDELEHDRLSLSKFQINQTGSFASDIHDKLNGVSTYDDSPRVSLNMESSYKSHSVTWVEKTEILKPTSPRSCDDILVDGTKYVEPVSSGLSNIETETESAILETIDRGNSIFHTANVQEPLSSVNHFDEVTSETENYMDALNTLESETETDSECQTKREVKSFSSFSCPQMESGTSQMQAMASPSSDVADADTITGSHCSLNEDESPDTYNLMPSESSELVQPPHLIGSIPDPNDSIGNEIFEHNAVDMSTMHNSEGLQYDQPPELSSCGSPTALGPTTTAAMSPDSPPVNSSIPKPKFWTNGGLLGLEPSKPPDFGVSKVSSEDFVSDSNVSGYDYSSSSQVTKLHQETLSSSNENISRNAIFAKRTDGSPNSSFNQSSLSGDQHFGRSDNVVPQCDPYKHSASYLDNQLYNMPANQNSQRHLQALSLSELGKIQDPLPSNINAQNGFHITAPRGAELPRTNSVELQPNESSQNTMDIASSLSTLAQRILANSLQRKPSITQAQYGDVDADIDKAHNTSLLNNQKGQTRVVSESYHAENTDNMHSISSNNSISSSSHISGHSSPPLELMKISFHPMNGLETTKLKLEYASGSFRDSIEDLTFPSFQLLPGSNVPLEDNGSETDDDTFCRSCPCTSEDHLSPRSDSNSELWGQDDMSGGKNHEMYENLSRMSSSSVSSFKGFDTASGFENLEAENDILYFQKGNYVGLPGLDSFTSTHDKGKCDSLSIDPEDSASQSQNGLPPPPSLPPMQWKMMKSSFDKDDQRDSSVAEIVEHFNILQTQVTTGHKQQEPGIPRPPPFPETLACPAKKSHDGQNLNGHKETTNNDVKSKQLDGRKELLHQIGTKHDQQKLNGHKEPKIPCANGQEVDEREELLHQIRNQTFNLRRTSTAKPPLEPQPTNINVAAILEKAKAIRQAFVGSDDGGGDDNWSDG